MENRTQSNQPRPRARRLALAATGVVVLGAMVALRFAVPAASSARPDPTASAQDGARGGGAQATARPPVTTTRHGVALPESRVEPEIARGAALEYEKGKFNAFFDGRMFLAKAMANGTLSVKSLKDQLLSIDELKALRPGIQVLSEKPTAVVERMAMIDTLEAMADDDPTALDALAEVTAKPIEHDLAVEVKRAVAGEKYDIFVALARRNWDLAKQSYLDLQNPALMELLRPALIGGLVDSGLSRATAVSKVAALAAPDHPDGT